MYFINNKEQLDNNYMRKGLIKSEKADSWLMQLLTFIDDQTTKKHKGIRTLKSNPKACKSTTLQY